MNKLTLALVLALLLPGCMEAPHPTESGPAGLSSLAFSVQQPACDVGQLIQAINTANATWGSTINLPTGCTYDLTTADNIHDNSPSEFGVNGLPVIISSITINGNGATMRRSPTAGSEFRIFYVLNRIGPGGAPVTLTLNDLTISGAEFSNSGAGLFNDGAVVVLNRVTLSGNVAGDAGGGLHNESGTVHVNYSTISGNSAADDGGGINNAFGKVFVDHSTISGNEAQDDGGGLHNLSGTVTITFSTISGNRSIDWGGGVSNLGGTIVIRTSTLTANTASDQGGGLVNVDGTVTVADRSIVSGNHAEDDGGGLANYGANTLNVQATTLNIDNSSVLGNNALDDGGGVVNAAGTVNLTNSLVSGNTAHHAGAGVRNENRGGLTVLNSAIADNVAEEDGGGLSNVDGTAAVTASTISGNSAKWGAGAFNEGGVIPLPGTGEPYGTLILVNSTLSGNRASEGAGGLFNDQGGRFQIRYSTVSGNTAVLKGGGGVVSFNDVAARAIVRSSIIAGNAPDDVAAGEAKSRYTSLGFNLIGRAGAFVDFTRDFRAAGDRRNVTDPGLGPLRFNGGPTWTHAVLPGSLAHNASGGGCPATDQRGAARPSDAACDIGAFEFRPEFGGTVLPVTEVTITRFPTNAWDEKDRKTLVEIGKLDVIKKKDDISYDVSATSYLFIEFENIPPDSTVKSVKLRGTYSTENGFTAGSSLWQVGGGTRTSPLVAMEMRPAGFEPNVNWDVSPWVRTAARVNNLSLTIRNLDPEGKKVMVDQTYLEVTYGPTPPASTTGFPVTLFVLDGWDSKDGTTLAETGKLSFVNGSDDVRAEVETGHFVSYKFVRIPAGSVVQLVNAYVEHHEEEGFASGGVVWRVGGGLLESPTTLVQSTPAVLSGELREATVEWGVGGTINTAALVNDLKFVVRNNDALGKKAKIDRVYAVVTHREP